MNYFIQKQQLINDFVTRANPLLGDNPLFYPGHFITGKIYKPDILFISINPGHSNREDWNDVALRREKTQLTEFKTLPIKYLEDAERGSRYANRIVNLICIGDVQRLKNCAETNFVSYFAAPKEEVLQKQLAMLSQNLRNEHHQLTQLNLDKIEPKHILCIGWRSFERFISQYGEGNEVITHSLPLMGKMENYYAKTKVAGVTVHGVRHLCTKLTVEMRKLLKMEFEQVWMDIENSN